MPPYPADQGPLLLTVDDGRAVAPQALDRAQVVGMVDYILPVLLEVGLGLRDPVGKLRLSA